MSETFNQVKYWHVCKWKRKHLSRHDESTLGVFMVGTSSVSSALFCLSLTSLTERSLRSVAAHCWLVSSVTSLCTDSCVVPQYDSQLAAPWQGRAWARCHFRWQRKRMQPMGPLTPSLHQARWNFVLSSHILNRSIVTASDTVKCIVKSDLSLHLWMSILYWDMFRCLHHITINHHHCLVVWWSLYRWIFYEMFSQFNHHTLSLKQQS